MKLVMCVRSQLCNNTHKRTMQDSMACGLFKKKQPPHCNSLYTHSDEESKYSTKFGGRLLTVLTPIVVLLYGTSLFHQQQTQYYTESDVQLINTRCHKLGTIHVSSASPSSYNMVAIMASSIAANPSWPQVLAPGSSSFSTDITIYRVNRVHLQPTTDVVVSSTPPGSTQYSFVDGVHAYFGYGNKLSKVKLASLSVVTTLTLNAGSSNKFGSAISVVYL